jgi:hypothetical protein
MKKLFTSFAISVLLISIPSLQSCTKDPLKILLQFNDLNFAVPAGVNNVMGSTIISKSQWEPFFKDNGQTFDIRKVNKLDFKNFVLKIDGTTLLDDFEFGELQISNIDGTNEKKIAFIGSDSWGKGKTEVSFSSQGENLKEYLNQDQFKLRLLVYRDPASSGTPLTFKGNLNLEVEYSQK